ncbi:MAG: lipo-like protein [Gemmatimonadetes bacterium]|nr:lipo-like protein [Gemmatimonadota bacterium]
MRALDGLGRRFARWLNTPRHAEAKVATNAPGLLARTIQPGDVLLVEGSSRISSAIKYLTQSSWSHSALCVGLPDPTSPPEREPSILLEADVSEGVRLVPLARYADLHTRICRPVGLSPGELQRVIQHAMARLGHHYDMKHIVDLARYLLPTPPVPSRYRRRLLALGSGDPTRAICSSLIAEAYQSVRYPILPDVRQLVRRVDGREEARQVLHIRHFSLFTPRDFDVSPYFEIVKPTLRHGFDPHAVQFDTPTLDRELTA